MLLPELLFFKQCSRKGGWARTARRRPVERRGREDRRSWVGRLDSWVSSGPAGPGVCVGVGG